jgi:Xaa-Pro dipeptidase
MPARIDREVHDARLQRVQGELAAAGMHALIATKPQTFFYLSDFNPILFSHPTIVVLPATGPPTLLVWAIRFDHARAESAIDDVRLFGRWGDRPSLAPEPYEALRAVVEERRLGKAVLGVEEDHLSARLVARLRMLFPWATLADASPIVERARAVKDRAEIARLRSAGALADEGMRVALEAARERSTEAEIAMRAEAAMGKMWAHTYPDHETAGFAGSEGAVWNTLWCWVVSGPRLMFNADTPKARRVQDGDLALLQIWATFDGYTAENERTVAVGPLPPATRLAFEAVLEARRAAFQAARPGVPCEAVYQAAADVFGRHGFGHGMPGRIGHSIGIGPHEPLSFGPGVRTPLVAGMAFTIEPGLFYGDVNIRHSDTIVITDGGYELITRTPAGILQV